MDVDRNLGERVLSLLLEVDLEQLVVDRVTAERHLQEYVCALGLPAPRIRWLRDLRELREGRNWLKDRGDWPSFTQRQWSLLDREWRLPREERQQQAHLARTDAVLLHAGLGTSALVRGVRWVTPSVYPRALALA